MGVAERYELISILAGSREVLPRLGCPLGECERADDVLLLPQIAHWCRSGGEASGLRRATLLLTPANANAPPFPVAAGGDAAEAERELDGIPNALLLRARISPAIVTEALVRMPPPCRVVVSGPGEFNTAVRGMLSELIDDEQVTILAA